MHLSRGEPYATTRDAPRYLRTSLLPALAAPSRLRDIHRALPATGILPHAGDMHTTPPAGPPPGPPRQPERSKRGHRSTAASRAARQFPQVPGQESLATSVQLREAGWTRSAVSHALSKTWQSPLPGVFAPHRAQLSANTLLVAASLWAGAGAVLTGVNALRCLGLKVDETGKEKGILLLVPERCRAREFQGAWGRARVRRTARPISLGMQTDVLLVAHAARAVVDAAVYEARTGADGEHLAISILQRGLCTPNELAEQITGRSTKAVEGLKRGLEAFVQGAWSRPEAVLRSVVDAVPDLPRMRTNVRLVHRATGRVVGTPDGYIEEAGVVIQVHSRAHHQGIDQQRGNRWARTVEKDGAYGAAGLTVVPVTPWTLYSAPHTFVAMLTSAVRVGLTRPPPDIIVQYVDRPRAVPT